MRASVIALAFVLLMPVVAAKEVWVPVAGRVQGASFFRSDVRVVNPSATKAITVRVSYLVAGVDGTGVTPVSITIPVRGMLVLDDIIGSLFNTTGSVGALRFVSDDDFLVTSRIYTDADCGPGGTYGQSAPGFDVAAAMRKGIIAHLSFNADFNDGFRTNIGFANPNGSAAAVKVHLYDGTNAVVKSVDLPPIPPFSATSPTSLRTMFGLPEFAAPNAWVSFESNQPVFGYGSIVDNRSRDQVYIAASPDSGSVPQQPSVKVFRITARQWQFDVEQGSIRVAVGDRVRLEIRSVDVTHGFILSPFVNNVVLSPGRTEVVEFDATQAGTFEYFCTVFCGDGHAVMSGSIVVGTEQPPSGPGY